jgi:hypothetical protein
MLGRLLRLLVIGWIVSMVAAAIAAMSVKRRLQPTTDESADEIVAVAIFGPLAFHSTAPAFRGGEVECWYGGGVIDLRDATLAPEGATLRIRAVFGGGQILVPSSWKVVSRATGLGGVQDIRPAVGHAAMDPELVIEGMLVGGGFAVSSEMPEGSDDWIDKITDQQANAAPDAGDAARKVEASAGATASDVADAIEATADRASEVAAEAGEEMAPAT